MKSNEKEHAITAALFTLGCKVNQYESRAMAERLEKAGAEIRSGGICDIYIINTCAVTAESDRKARQIIRRCIARNPDAVVAVCGCSSQLHREQTAAIEGVDIVCGSADKFTAADSAYALAKRRREVPGSASCECFKEDETFRTNGVPYDTGMSVAGFDRIRSYVKIEDGCNSGCAYCIIPKVRGSVRSRPPEDVLREVRILAGSGCREIVLTGIETSAYGYGLIELIKAADTVDGITRIRLGSMDPVFLNRPFADAVAELEHFMPHLHVSVQSGCSRTLAAMRRKYNAETALRNIAYLKERISAMRFSADIIAGFPGETDDDFTETLSFAEKAGFLHIHIFTYSPRPGTEAAAMADQIPEIKKAERAAALGLLQRRVKKRLLDCAVADGKPAQVLFETYKNGRSTGHAEDFTEYSVTGSISLRGQLHTVIPLSHDGEIMEGRII